MNPKTTGMLFVIAAALGAFVYFYEIRGGEARQEAEARAKRLFPDVEADAIEWIAFTTTDGQTARLERREERWELTQPLPFPADEFAADGMASALAQLSSEESFSDPEARDVYGLEADEREVRFGAGEEEHALRTGDTTPVGGNTYARVGDSDTVYTVPSYRVNSLRKELKDLREKRVLHFDTASIERVEARWPDGRVVAERGDEGWHLTAPLEGRADEATLDALLSDLSFLRAEDFVDEPPPDDQVGLDRPDYAVTLTAQAEEGEEEPRRFHLSVAPSLDGESRLVRAGRSDTLFRIPADRISDFPRELIAYRFKQLAKFIVSEAKRIEIAFHSPAAGETVLVSATRGETGWEATPEAVKQGRMGRMVSELSRLRAAQIVADRLGRDELVAVGLSPPQAIVSVYGTEAEEGGAGDAEAGEARLAEVHLGIVRDDGSLIAQAAGEETVFALEAGLTEHLPANLEAFRSHFVSASESEEEDEELALEADGLPSPAAESP